MKNEAKTINRKRLLTEIKAPKKQKMENHTKIRINMADWAKAVAIYLVILSHTAVARPIANYAFMVEIPLFFFMSGYLFRFERNPQFKPFFKKRFRQIMVPYFSINAVTYLFWLLVGRHYGADSSIGIPAWKPLVGILTGDSSLLYHNATMYFFTTLFNVEILFYIIFRGRRFSARIAVTLLFAVLGGIDYYYNPIVIPFSISHTLVAMVFYSIGHEMRSCRVFNNFINSHSVANAVVKLSMALVLFSVSIILFKITGAVNLQKREFSFYPLYFAETFVAISFIATVCSIPSALPVVIKKISTNTLWLCGYHLMIFTFIKGFLVFVLRMDISMLDNSILPNILFSLSALAICLCGIKILRSIRLKGILRK